MSKYTKKVAVSLAVLGVAMWKPTSASAVFASSAKFPVTASAVLTGAGVATMSAPQIKLIGTNAAETQINWPTLTLPVAGGWALSADYIQVNSNITASNGGIQIYTDNTAVGATPRFTGNTANVDPSGLVDATNTALRLPMAWSIKDGAAGVPTTPIAAEPNQFATNANAPQWIYIADRQTKASVGGGATTFTDGAPNSEVLDGTLGIHAASGIPPAGFFVGSFPVTYIYTQANFAAATTPRTYATSTLTLESFTQ